MRARTLWMALILLHCGLSVAVSAEKRYERWEGSNFLGKAVVQVERVGSVIRGVAYLHDRSGKVDVYHFEGTLKGDRIEAAHHEGHSFRGRLFDGGGIVGVLTTRKGMRWPVRARRSAEGGPLQARDQSPQQLPNP